MPETITCKRCGQRRTALGYAPFPTELGQQVGAEACQQCWSEWLQKQQMLINHYGLNLMDPDAQNFLFDNMKSFFFSEGQTAQIDTTKEGTINW